MSANSAPASYLELCCYAVKVRSRGEESVANSLRDRGYEVLAPTYTELRAYSDRTRKVSCALFPGYVFVRMDPAHMLRLISTDGVSYVVRSGRGIEPLTADETRSIEALCRMEKTRPCEPCNFLAVGQRVVVEAGPLAGLEGVLVRVSGVERVVVAIESLHRSVSVEIGHDRVRPVAPSDLLAGSAARSLEFARAL